MPIKNPEILTRDDCDSALTRLGISIADAARDSGVPRSYLSEFLNRKRELTVPRLTALRSYLEGQGIEFTRSKADAKPSAGGATDALRYLFAIDGEIAPEVVARTVAAMSDNDARIATLMQQAIRRTDPLFADPDFTDESRAALQEAFSLMAENYALFRMLRGWPALKVPPGADEAETLRNVVLATFRERFIEAGLIEQSSDNAAEKTDAPAVEAVEA